MSSNNQRVYIYDTTLRDGAQASSISLNLNDKRVIADALDEFGVDYIEGGWPGANQTDDHFFAQDHDFQTSIFTAFGMTKKAGNSAENDPTLSAVINSNAKAYCLVGKTWMLHVEKILGISPEENLNSISESIRHASKDGKEVIFDAEHFFDGYKDNPEYSLQCLKAAKEAGAKWLVLCDTNGGTMPQEIEKIIGEVANDIDPSNLGIHAHNDTEQAVANSIAAVKAGARMVQGTLNGIGERCGNANLTSLMPTLSLKLGYDIGIPQEKLKDLKKLSRILDECINEESAPFAPYVGDFAFAHKGGLHVSAVNKIPESYEHINPDKVGNSRNIVVSDQTGRSNVIARLKTLGFDDDTKSPLVKQLVDTIKQREFEGYAYDTAQASFAVLYYEMTDQMPAYFDLLNFSVTNEIRAGRKNDNNDTDDFTRETAKATVKLSIKGDVTHTASDGIGPVHALEKAFSKALKPVYPSINDVVLIDYRVRIVNSDSATAATVRVMIESALKSNPHKKWRSVGVSTNILEASFIALKDSYLYHLKNLEDT